MKSKLSVKDYAQVWKENRAAAKGGRKEGRREGSKGEYEWGPTGLTQPHRSKGPLAQREGGREAARPVSRSVSRKAIFAKNLTPTNRLLVNLLRNCTSLNGISGRTASPAHSENKL